MLFHAIPCYSSIFYSMLFYLCVLFYSLLFYSFLCFSFYPIISPDTYIVLSCSFCVQWLLYYLSVHLNYELHFSLTYNFVLLFYKSWLSFNNFNAGFTTQRFTFHKWEKQTFEGYFQRKHFNHFIILAKDS